MCVLVADSDDASLEIMRSFLHDHGYEVKTSGSGLECLAMLREFAPDVLVLNHDLLWGGGDGVMSQMRDDAALVGTPVIVLTGDPSDELRSAKRPTVVEWLRTPFQLSELQRHVESVGKQTARLQTGSR